MLAQEKKKLPKALLNNWVESINYNETRDLQQQKK